MEYIPFDAHQHYTLASVARPDGQLVREQRIAHERGRSSSFSCDVSEAPPVAVETVGNWYVPHQLARARVALFVGGA